ncbi:MAG: sigma-70 family RNA polymerase sigma factor [Planctomycetota bacterium]
MDRESKMDQKQVRKAIREELTGDTGKSMYRYALRLTKSDDLAWEIFQEACKNLLSRGNPKIDGSMSLRPYMMKTVLNAYLSRKRSERVWNKYCDDCQKNVKRPPQVLTGSNADPFEKAASKEQIKEFAMRLSNLTDEARELLHLSYVERASYAQIARDFGVSPGTIRNKIKAIVQDIRSKWPEGDE